MKHIKIPLMLVGCILFITASAQTPESFRKKGKIGVGSTIPLFISSTNFKNQTNTTDFSTVLVGALGTATYHVTPKIPVSLGLGFRVSTDKTKSSGYESETKKSGPVIQVSAGTPIISLVGKGVSNSNAIQQLDVLLGFTAFFTSDNIKYTSTDVTGTFTSEEKSTSFLFAPTIKPEWFITEHLAIHTQIGVVFSILDESNSAFSEGGVHVQIFSAADLLGSAGFTFYF